MTLWQQLDERFNTLQRREQLMIWASTLLLTLWLVFVYVLEPLSQAGNSYGDRLASVQKQQQEAQLLVTTLRSELGTDADAEYRQRIAQLEQQQRELTAQITQSTRHFIAAEQMVALLHNVLQSSSGVQLKQLTTAAPKAVLLAGQTEADTPLLYQHQLTLVINSNYAALLKVLNKIEQLPWLVNWAGLHYQVTDYPSADLTLELITVSEHEDFIRL
jgi:MSHA biogenesis protein MshJ